MKTDPRKGCKARKAGQVHKPVNSCLGNQQLYAFNENNVLCTAVYKQCNIIQTLLALFEGDFSVKFTIKITRKILHDNS